MTTTRFEAVLLAMGFVLTASCMSEGPSSRHAGLTETPVDDFTGGVAQANHPESAGAYGVWYDATFNTFGTPSASTLDGAPAMRIDDGGFANGVYAIFGGTIPADGTYQISVPVRIVEAATATNGIRAYQVGVAVGAGAVHRGAGSTLLPGAGVSASYVGLTTGDDNALPTQTLVTAPFEAHAGDDVLIAFGTDVTSGAWNAGSGTWGGSYALVGAITLLGADPVPDDGSVVLDDDDGAPDFTQSGAWSVSGGVGHGGGHYRFASSGNATSTATWEAEVEPGYYDVEVTYRAGTNRASSAHYTVSSGDATFATSVNQQTRDQQWVYIGGIDASSGTIRVTLDAAGCVPTGTVVIADAVRFLPSAAPPVDEPEMRVAAVTIFDNLDDVGAIQSMVDEIASHHYNAIAVHARFRGDATYLPNRVSARYPNAEPRSPHAGDVDVLAEFVARGHERGLKVFAYVNTHLVTEGSASPTDPNHVVNAHPDWRTYAYNGGAPTVQTTAEDGEGLWLEPALPEVQRYLADIVGDIASNYAIDGVVLDRIRYPQTAFTRENRDFGYHPEAIERFNRRYHKEGVPSPRDADWIEFRQQAVTDAVAAIYARLGRIDPELLLLAYPIGRLNDARTFNYQDWPRWMTEGVIDGVLPQLYDAASFNTALTQHAEAYGGDRLLGVSLDAFRAGHDLAGQIEAARISGFAGTSPFRHGTMADLGYLAHLRQGWDGTAEWPATPWKGARVQSLDLEGSCTEDSSRRRWRVSNPNEWAIPVEWRVVMTGESGEYFAPPGDSSFEVEVTGRMPALALLSWQSERRTPRIAAALSHPRWCR
jgi:uncharacterized lipoprotein YddW (UPF0748 family)